MNCLLVIGECYHLCDAPRINAHFSHYRSGVYLGEIFVRTCFRSRFRRYASRPHCNGDQQESTSFLSSSLPKGSL